MYMYMCLGFIHPNKGQAPAVFLLIIDMGDAIIRIHGFSLLTPTIPGFSTAVEPTEGETFGCSVRIWPPDGTILYVDSDTNIIQRYPKITIGFRLGPGNSMSCSWQSQDAQSF